MWYDTLRLKYYGHFVRRSGSVNPAVFMVMALYKYENLIFTAGIARYELGKL